MKLTLDIDNPANRGSRWAAFLALTLFAGGLRLYRLDQGFWYDEIVSFIRFFQAPWRELFTAMPLPNHHPLYSLLAKVCLLIFGEEEWAARLPAFIAGSLTPGLVFLFGRRFWDGRTGFLAGVLLSLAMWPVWWSQDARGYALMILFSLFATYLFLVIYDRPSWKYAASYALLAVLSVYSHLFAAAVIGSHFMIALTLVLKEKHGRFRKNAMLAAASLLGLFLSLLVYLPMLSDFYQFVLEQGTITTGRAMSFSFAGRLLTAWSAGYERPLLSLVVLVPGAAGLVLVARKKPLLVTALVLPIALGCLASLFTGTFVFHRFYSYGIYALYLFCAVGVTIPFTFRRWWAYWIGVAAMIAVIAVVGFTLADYYGKHKQALRTSAEWTEKTAPHKQVIALGFVSGVYRFYDHDARLVGKDRELSRQQVENSMVVTSFAWSISKHNRNVLDDRCKKAAFFPSAGPRELDVRVYQCE
ncbi:MAG: glycosyltransferase family 39 protein [bacterium]